MMPSLSRSIIFYEWKHFLTAVVSLGFSAFLIYMQAGLAMGNWFKTENAFLEGATNDLWISNAEDVKSFVARYEIDLKNEFDLRMHPEVQLLQTFWWSHVQCKTDADCSKYAWLIPVDRNNNYLCVSRGFMRDFGALLEEPLTVVFDRCSAAELKLKVGDTLELSNKKVRVVGLTEEYEGSNVPFIFASQATFHYVDPQKNPNHFDYLLVCLKDAAMKERVRDELNAMQKGKPRFLAWTKDDMYWKSLYFWLFFNESSLLWIFLVFLALVVGISVTNQSLRGAILGALKEYATLRALGVGRRSLCGVVLRQACWIGVAGLLLGLLLTGGFCLFAQYSGIPFYVPLWLILPASAVVLGATLLSGVIAMSVLYKTQPAELLR